MNVCLHEKLCENNKRWFIKPLKKKRKFKNVEILRYKGAIEGVASVKPTKTGLQSQQTGCWTLHFYLIYLLFIHNVSRAPSNCGAPTNKETSWPRPFVVLTLSLKDESKSVEVTSPSAIFIFLSLFTFPPDLPAVCVFLLNPRFVCLHYKYV